MNAVERFLKLSPFKFHPHKYSLPPSCCVSTKIRLSVMSIYLPLSLYAFLLIPLSFLVVPLFSELGFEQNLNPKHVPRPAPFVLQT